MKLFNDFEAVIFPEENKLFVTRSGYIYYICNLDDNDWRKYRNAGNDHITVDNYQDISKEELVNTTGGIYPQKETDFMRMCKPSQLRVGDFMKLLEEDYPAYMSTQSDWLIHYSTDRLLTESGVPHKTYLELKKLFDKAVANEKPYEETLNQLKDLSFIIVGRDIYKNEIGIVDGHNGSSYFWFMPVRVYDYSDTNDWDTVAEMKSVEISIEEDDVDQFLTPFLYKYFDDGLEANKNRIDHWWIDDDGIEHPSYIEGFEWWLTHNFYTYESMESILKDMKDTIDALSLGRNNEYTDVLKEKRGWAAYTLAGARNLTKEQVDEYNANRPTADDTKPELIIDFYQRFIYRMEYMLRVGKEKGYNLISVMGP